jgi:hypothetical protein
MLGKSVSRNYQHSSLSTRYGQFYHLSPAEQARVISHILPPPEVLKGRSIVFTRNLKDGQTITFTAAYLADAALKAGAKRVIFDLTVSDSLLWDRKPVDFIANIRKQSHSIGSNTEIVDQSRHINTELIMGEYVLFKLGKISNYNAFTKKIYWLIRNASAFEPFYIEKAAIDGFEPKTQEGHRELDGLVEYFLNNYFKD